MRQPDTTNPSFEERIQLNAMRIAWARFLWENDIVASFEDDELILSSLSETAEGTIVTLCIPLDPYDDVE